MKPRNLILAAAVLTVMGGCANLPRPMMEPGSSALDKPSMPEKSQTIGLSGDDAEMEIPTQVSQSWFVANPLETSDPLPDIMVSPVSLSTASPYEAMRQILAGTGISFAVNFEHPGAQIQRRNFVADGMSGKLQTVLGDIANSLGVYYSYRNGTITLMPDKQYIVSLPPIDSVMDGLPGMLKTLGATDIYMDKASRTLSFRAARPPFDKISGYLDYIRSTKQLIIYDAYIYEVILNDTTQTGIQWNKFAYGGDVQNSLNTSQSAGASGTTGAATAGSGILPKVANLAASSMLNNGLGLSLVYNTNHFAIDVLLNFLQSQGRVTTLSQPKMMVMSGSSTTFKVGNSTFYVSQQGMALSNNVTIPTTQTTQLDTGFNLTLAGDITDGTIITKATISTKDLQKFNTIIANGQAWQLPQTSFKDLDLISRARAGDTILLAGINSSRDQQDIVGLPGGAQSISLATNVNKSVSRSEFVMVMRPRIIRFAPAKKEEKVAAADLSRAPAAKAIAAESAIRTHKDAFLGINTRGANSGDQDQLKGGSK